MAPGIEVARRIREREISPVEVMDATLRTIEERNPRLNAFAYMAFDEAMEAARAAERRAPVGPLHGVPTALKDLFDFKPGWPATMGGIRALRDYRPPFACAWCERMERAGAIIVGKTNSPSMGLRGVTDNYLFGPTRNPWDLERNAGGSSGGAAAAVADGLLTIAEGTDGGGSIRIPAAWCGVYGYKPSWGRVPSIVRPNAGGLRPARAPDGRRAPGAERRQRQHPRAERDRGRRGRPADRLVPHLLRELHRPPGRVDPRGPGRRPPGRHADHRPHRRRHRRPRRQRGLRAPAVLVVPPLDWYQSGIIAKPWR
jgi:Amidase